MPLTEAIPLVVLSIILTACGGSTPPDCVENCPPPPFIPPEYVPLPSCLYDDALIGAPADAVTACAGEPCAAETTHQDPMVTTGWALYCAEAQCSADCYWHVRVYFENGRVSYRRTRSP